MPKADLPKKSIHINYAYIITFLLALVSIPFKDVFTSADILDAICIVFLWLSLTCVVACIFPNKTGNIINAFLWIIFLAFQLVGEIYFSLYGSFPAYDNIALLKDADSLILSFSILKLIAATFIIIGSWYLVFRFFNYFKTNKSQRLIHATIILILSLICHVTFVHNFRFDYNLYEDKLGSNSTTLEFNYERRTNPLSYFIRSAGIPYLGGLDKKLVRDNRLKTYVANLQKSQQSQLPEDYQLSSFQSWLPQNDKYTRPFPTRYPLYAKAKTSSNVSLNTKTPNKNIIVIVLESFRASESGAYGAKESATPFIDELAKKSLLATNFYSTAPLTMKSEVAINCSILDYLGGSPKSTSGSTFKAYCLPKLLSQHSYETFWIHANEKEFYERGVFHPLMGFDFLFDEEKLIKKNEQTKMLGWGMPDTLMFDKALDILENRPKCCFYAEILTLSNHLPFDYDWGISFPEKLQQEPDEYFYNYKKGLYYTDQSLKHFFERFKKSELYDNTLLIITGDHGIWTFENENKLSALNKHEQFFRVPLLIHGKNIQPSTIAWPADHLDIAPSIMDWLALTADNHFIGRSLFQAEIERPIYTMLERTYGVRLGNEVCIPKQTCFRNGGACKSTKKATRIEELTSDSVCYQITSEQNAMFSEGDEVNHYPDKSLSQLLDYAHIALDYGFLPSTP